MKVDQKVVDKLSGLAKLEFDEHEKERLINDLNRILEFVEQLNQVDTRDVEPLIYMTEEKNVLRPDVAENTLTHDEALLNAPKNDSDYFRVPKVLENK